MDGFFERLREETLKIYANDCAKSMGWIAPHDDYVKKFETINWDSKQFYIELAMSKIYLDGLTD